MPSNLDRTLIPRRQRKCKGENDDFIGFLATYPRYTIA